MWSIVSSIIGGVLTPLTSVLNTWVQGKNNIDLQKVIVNGQVDTSLLQANVAIIQAQAQLLQNKWLVYLQVGFGLPLMIYYGKCILWDKVLGLGSTDPLKGDISTYSIYIIGFLFLHSTITSWGRK